jgi:hypothetical protein
VSLCPHLTKAGSRFYETFSIHSHLL